MLKRVTIDTSKIHNWSTFHEIFKKVFGFPKFYGQNNNAWIDCMSSIDDEESGMVKLTVAKTDTLLIELTNTDKFKEQHPDIYFRLFELVAFVNYRKLEMGDTAIIAISAT